MSDQERPQVVIYTDGACKPNPGPGGWGAVLLFPSAAQAGKRPPRPQELSGGEANTTNNRMELRAALEALKSLAGAHRIQLYTDSQYLRRGVTEWLPVWQARGWQTTGRTAVKNQDLWRALAAQLTRHDLTWHWTRGHAGDRWNEHADRLARSEIEIAALPLDDRQCVHLFTAVSYLGKEKKGAWAVRLRYREQIKHLSGGETDTSSNRLHIRAALEGLQALTRPIPVHLYTTSDYLKNGATAWSKGWAANGWKTRDNKPVRHRALWEALAVLTRRYAITWHVLSARRAPDEMTQLKKLAGEAARAAGEMI